MIFPLKSLDNRELEMSTEHGSARLLKAILRVFPKIFRRNLAGWLVPAQHGHAGVRRSCQAGLQWPGRVGLGSQMRSRRRIAWVSPCEKANGDLRFATGLLSDGIVGRRGILGFYLLII